MKEILEKCILMIVDAITDNIRNTKEFHIESIGLHYYQSKSDQPPLIEN